MESIQLRVGIGDCKITKSPNSIITVGLGSCVGIALYDNKKKIGGLAHIMLPDSTQFSNTSNKYKFADLAIMELYNEILSLGASKNGLIAKVAGGASMFNFSDKKMVMDIGERNCTAVKKHLKNLDIPIISEELKGNKGRTMILDVNNGEVSIKTVGEGIKVI